MDGEYLIIPAVPSFPRERSLDNLHYLFMSTHEMRLEIFEMFAQEVRLAVDDFCSVMTKHNKLLITENLNYSLCR